MAVAIGVVVSSVPIAAAIAMAGAIYGRIAGRWCWESTARQWTMIGLIALVSAWFTPWYLFLPAAALGALVGAIDWFLGTGRVASDVSALRRRAGRSALYLTVTLVIYGVGATLFTMWLPHERLTLKDTPDAAIGYVVADSAGWLSLLKSGERKIVRIRDDRIVTRTICRGSDFHESPIQWTARRLGHRIGYLPPCRPASP